MGYSTKTEVKIALANALSQGNPSGGVGVTSPIINIGNTLTDAVPDSDLYQYIGWADATINSTLSSIYRTPLKKINLGSFPLGISVTLGDDTIVLSEANQFIPGDVLLIRDDTNTEELVVETSNGTSTLVFTTTIDNDYAASETNIEKIGYPEPISKISARLAAAYIFDKAFAAQADSNVSKYGEYLRGLASQDMNLILSGAIRLQVTSALDLVGMRYQNPALDDVFRTRAEPGKDFLKSL